MDTDLWTYTKPTQEWTPHPYQEKVIKLMLQQAAAGVLLDPGLGKTSCSLAAASILLKKEHINRVLVITPLRPLYSVWPAEIAKWSNFNHLKYHIFHGKGRNPHAIPADTELVLINPEGLLWLMDERFPKRFEALEVDTLIIDESTRFKDASTKRFKLLRKYLLKFKRRYILTGSISPNGLLDLFGQIYVLDRGHALGAYITHYKRMYFTQPNPMDPYKFVPTPEAHEQIAEKVSPLVIQMQAEDYLQMPELINHTVEITLPDAVMERYKEVDEEFITKLHDGSVVVAANAAVAGGKCRQIANGAIYVTPEDMPRETVYLHQEKVKALQEILEELGGNPALIGYEFQHDKDQILKVFPDMPVISGMSPKKVDALINSFNNGSVPYILGHPASMGHGLNMQGACHHVIWYGITWNFEHYDQMIRRVYRQGQKGVSVTVHHIVAKNTRDEKVLPVLEAKERTQKDFLNALSEPILFN